MDSENKKSEHEELIVKFPEADYVVRKLDKGYYSGLNPFTSERLTVIDDGVTVYIFVPPPPEMNPEIYQSIICSTQVLEHHLAKNKGLLEVIKQVNPNLDTIHIHVCTVPSEMPNQDGIMFKEMSRGGNDLALIMLMGSKVYQRLAPEPREFERYLIREVLGCWGLQDKLESILGQSSAESALFRKAIVGEMLDFDTEFVHFYPEDAFWIQDIEEESLKEIGAKKAIIKGKDRERQWMFAAHDRLLAELRQRILLHNIQDLIPAIYDQIEKIYIYREREIIQASLIGQRSGPNVTTSSESVERIEKVVAEHSVAYKYLLEVAIKISPTGDKPLTLEIFTELLALAKRISDIDFNLEWMNYEIFPVELHITEERHTYFVDRASSKGADKVTIGRARHIVASTLNKLAHNKEYAESDEEWPVESKQLLRDADEAFKKDLGYPLADQVKIQKALVDWFYQEHEYLRKIDRDTLSKELVDATMLPREKVELFLRDKELIQYCNQDDSGV